MRMINAKLTYKISASYFFPKLNYFFIIYNNFTSLKTYFHVLKMLIYWNSIIFSKILESELLD